MRVQTERARKMAERRAANAASEARMAAARAEAQAAAAANRCPTCGAGVHANLALTGWVQCDRLGADSHRRDKSGPACDWQGFTR